MSELQQCIDIINNQATSVIQWYKHIALSQMSESTFIAAPLFYIYVVLISKEKLQIIHRHQ